jgi:hypothetical protein
LTLGKTKITASELYVGGVVDQPLSLWFAERLRDKSLGD